MVPQRASQPFEVSGEGARGRNELELMAEADGGAAQAVQCVGAGLGEVVWAAPAGSSVAAHQGLGEVGGLKVPTLHFDGATLEVTRRARQAPGTKGRFVGGLCDEVSFAQGLEGVTERRCVSHWGEAPRQATEPTFFTICRSAGSAWRQTQQRAERLGVLSQCVHLLHWLKVVRQRVLLGLTEAGQQAVLPRGPKLLIGAHRVGKPTRT